MWAKAEILGELLMYSPHHVNTRPEMKPNKYLLRYTRKDCSACAEVWTGSYRARASITAPEGRSGQILQFLRIFVGLLISITRQVSQPTEMGIIEALV